MTRPYNFSGGPAMLPEAVLKKAQVELLDWQGLGMSVMEVSHRSQAFSEFAANVENTVRKLLSIPDNYKILFLSGGASTQFAMVPLNLLARNQNRQALYFETGYWSKKAITQAQQYGQIILENKITNINNPDLAYVHYTANETIDGKEYHGVPNTGDVPLVADMTSNLFSRPIDIHKFGLIYAGAQKNFGQAGVTMVIIREDLISEYLDITPNILIYKNHVKANSFYNTPPVFSWYIAGLVFEWIAAQGGVEEMSRQTQAKKELLYQFIDESNFYHNSVSKEDRSWMNVVFKLADESQQTVFLEQAQQQNLLNLKGHRAVGGIRASLYLGMPLDGVKKLVQFMAEFAKNHG